LKPVSAHRAAIIYNPVARKLSRQLSQLAQNGIEAHLVPTIAPNSAGWQAREQIEAGCDLIIAAGGDGTINEVIDGMLYSSVPLAIFPGGTANVLARELRLPLHLTTAARQVRLLEPCRVATGSLMLNDGSARSFICMAGAGLDAEIVYRLNLDLKAAAGKLAYYIGGFSQVFRPLSEFQVIVDGKAFAASFALVSRVRNYGGDLEIARGASLLRDDFELVLFRGTVSARYLGYLAGVLTKRLHKMNGCTVLRAWSVRFMPASGDQNVFTQLDGELAGKLPASVTSLPNALTLLVPPEYLLRERSRVNVPAYA
jgi:diacylglycerol kinase (ATP)